MARVSCVYSEHAVRFIHNEEFIRKSAMYDRNEMSLESCINYLNTSVTHPFRCVSGGHWVIRRVAGGRCMHAYHITNTAC